MTEKSSNEGFSIQSNISFQTEFRLEKQLTTPFGDIYVTVNGETVSFHHRKENYLDVTAQDIEGKNEEFKGQGCKLFG